MTMYQDKEVEGERDGGGGGRIRRGDEWGSECREGKWLLMSLSNVGTKYRFCCAAHQQACASSPSSSRKAQVHRAQPPPPPPMNPLTFAAPDAHHRLPRSLACEVPHQRAAQPLPVVGKLEPWEVVQLPASVARQSA